MNKTSMIPMSISAKTPEDLSRVMYENNEKYGVQFLYFDIQKDNKNWIAWYYMDLTEAMMLKTTIRR
jgi:hypothetical protein